MIEFEHVVKRYSGRTVIPDLSLRLEQGRITVVIGASGSGKSTLLKMVNRLEERDGGEIRFQGRDIRSFGVEDLRRRMGYAIQSNGLFPHWTVARNIATVPRLLGWPPERIRARVDELLEMLDLPPAQYRSRHPHQLSGGQQQRVGVARAMAADPEILLMDEPFGALDPVTRASLQHEVRRLHQRLGKTILLITHDIDEALFLADHLILLDQGRILQQGSPQDILSQPASDAVRDFLGRDDLGLRHLALRPVSAVMRPVGDLPPDSVDIADSATLRQALSLLLASRCEWLRVCDAAGQAVGQLHALDVLGLRTDHAA
ncbi:ABC transporter ATP-binding protein [Amphibiibacter pelophylacis]|uniref:ABC transporter ATP-binding protein n=1 Tax=Amphibiibacter pelophylacis TaxID=1799477 RepID=A0ACC6P5J1_9BURK